ncbi:unnamed protein product [Mytilus coruscus]|uniref:Farnesoic acid O-methyl transferase domain-containing protein n=1 Tax=Mytilus coruscus TaxID=42192 RepID=A0A6J8E0C2_MYTCO|nr:unnamed protein product [Mytilus coruscus]
MKSSVQSSDGKKLFMKFDVWFARIGAWDIPVYMAKLRSPSRMILDFAFWLIRSSEILSCSMYVPLSYGGCQGPNIETPNRYKYILLSDNGIDIGNPEADSIKFKVKASSNAHVALMSSNTDQHPLYEIVLGGWTNSKSVIRDRKQGKALVTHLGQVLKQNEYRTFYIQWTDGKIKVEDEWNRIIMEWTDTSNPLNIRNIGVSTGWGSTGYWSFVCPGIQEPENNIFSRSTEWLLFSLPSSLLVIVTFILCCLFVRYYRRHQISSPLSGNQANKVDANEHDEEIDIALEKSIDKRLSPPGNNQIENHDMRDDEQMSMPTSIRYKKL